MMNLKILFVVFPLFIGALFLISVKNRVLKVFLNIFKSSGIIIIVLVLLRLYWFDIYKIPSESMERTLLVGDKILIRKNKLPENNDIVVFEKKDWDTPTVLVKRCIGIPGDSVSIHLDSVFINGVYLPDEETMQRAYCLDSCCLDRYKLSKIINRSAQVWSSDKNKYVALTAIEYHLICSVIPDINLPRATKRSEEEGNVFPWKAYLLNNWNNIKPFYIPKRGDTIFLDKENSAWYGEIIKKEISDVTLRNDSVQVNNKSISHYSFRHNYYYMMGDNRDQSADSRAWGFVREDEVLGRVFFVLKTSKKLD